MNGLFATVKLALVTLLASQSQFANAFPAWQSLGGLSEQQLDKVMPMLKARAPPPPPGPPAFTGAKLVNDRAHPFKPLKKGDVRGPCPGLNTLASHGYLPRNGVASPSQIIDAVQEGFNMENELARFTTYVAHLVDGNLVTDLLSIGEKTRKTGPDPPPPAIVGGLNNHGTFEGDASLTRGDAVFGDNHNFNQELFDQFKNFSAMYGNGFFNMTVAGELRFHRIQQSIATNPEFSLVGLRHLTAYAEASFPSLFFVDGRKTGAEAGQLDMATAESFFRDMMYPPDFFRPAAPVAGDAGAIFLAHPFQPGRNVGGVNNFTVDDSLGSLLDFCGFYENFVNKTLKALYPNPKGVLRRNLNINLQFFFESLPKDESGTPVCTQVFPYGRN
ncbi:Aromatic peroxygenase [Coprinopsis cinerea AmutBmut pab1-1]|nr:Aromatic peroxygenase [Coprinopsis cinerea AmutBmut pab1-1]